MLALSLAAVFTSSTAFAGWQQDVSAAEIDRLNQLPQICDAAIADAKAGDWRAVVRVMEPEARTIPANALTGNWRCRPSPTLGAQVTPDDQIGLLTGIGDNHLRLEIPAVQESLLDVVEFAR